MNNDFSIDLTADIDRVPDGGRVSHLSLRFRGRPVLTGLIVEYEDNFTLVDQISVNEVFLPSPTARRLLALLYRQFMPMIGEFGDSGLITSFGFHDFLRKHYEDDRERNTVTSQIETVLRTFWTTSNGATSA